MGMEDLEIVEIDYAARSTRRADEDRGEVIPSPAPSRRDRTHRQI